MKPAIEIKKLSKKYRRGSNAPYLTLRDSLSGLLRRRKAGDLAKDEFWALKNINLEIMPGEVIGMIGRNGAGKSTLLKVLSRITHPTHGKVILRGKVGSLLEVGTGFHQELSGRDNIYLNGAVLGMQRAEIKRKFKEIIDFSGISDFVDTPVKHYSSGMYVRLAFAVAAHLDSNILLVDEVLAVGDAEFQKKCLRKIRDISGSGRTIIFVTHDLRAIQSLCSRVVWLEGGVIKKIGSAQTVIHSYLNSLEKKQSILLSQRNDRSGLGNLRFTTISYARRKQTTNSFAIGDPITIKLEVKNNSSKKLKYLVCLSIRGENEVGLISCDSQLINYSFSIAPKATQLIQCHLPRPPLNFGVYSTNIALYVNGELEDWIVGAGAFKIISGQYPGRVNSNPFPLLTDFAWEQ